MNVNTIQSKALDRASSTMKIAERIGLRGYSLQSYAIFGPQHAHGWNFTRKGDIEVIRVEPEALEALYSDSLADASHDL
ncbi:MAG: hypothetical protein KDJ22_03300 [Candidatus Competibacteraceae bacterium]|nr:hypothetical protein [Candidatus Competibacteraceae bacterium]MCP5125497.1 hypothetical protein [Gammaproteobacteria bacterium]HRX70643.1 hypothetical protein [Candidatus Competibacteraceae bacterium]